MFKLFLTHFIKKVKLFHLEFFKIKIKFILSCCSSVTPKKTASDNKGIQILKWCQCYNPVSCTYERVGCHRARQFIVDDAGAHLSADVF